MKRKLGQNSNGIYFLYSINSYLSYKKKITYIIIIALPSWVGINGGIKIFSSCENERNNCLVNYLLRKILH